MKYSRKDPWPTVVKCECGAVGVIEWNANRGEWVGSGTFRFAERADWMKSSWCCGDLTHSQTFNNEAPLATRRDVQLVTRFLEAHVERFNTTGVFLNGWLDAKPVI